MLWEYLRVCPGLDPWLTHGDRSAVLQFESTLNAFDPGDELVSVRVWLNDFAIHVCKIAPRAPLLQSHRLLESVAQPRASSGT
jgi:hypothetical protein